MTTNIQNDVQTTAYVPSGMEESAPKIVEEAAKVADFATSDGAPRPNQPGVSAAKYKPTTTDLELIRANIRAALSGVKGKAEELESQGIPYVTGLADWTVRFRIDNLSWPDKEATRKFVKETAPADKADSNYVKILIGQAVNIVRLVTDVKYNVFLGYAWHNHGSKKTEYTADPPTEGIEFKRALLAPAKVLYPTVGTGKAATANTSEQLVPCTFNAANNLAKKVFKGVRAPKPEGNATPGAGAQAASDVVKQYGFKPLIGAMEAMIASKETVPTVEVVTTPAMLALAGLAKLNHSYPDKIPVEMIQPWLDLFTELSERFETILDGADVGKVKVVSVDGATSYAVDPDSLPES